MLKLTIGIFFLAVATEASALNEAGENLLTNISDFKIVQTSNGAIRGKKDLTMYKKNAYYSFKGIPYAKPPIGQLRYKVKCVQMSFFERQNSLNYQNNGGMFLEATTKIGSLEWNAWCILIWQWVCATDVGEFSMERQRRLSVFEYLCASW